MIKDFLKNSFIYGLSNLLTRGISFLLLPIYTKTLSSSDYGVVSYLSNILIFLPFVSWEVIQAVGIYYCEQHSEKLKKEYLSSAGIFLLTTNSILFLIALLFSQRISSFLFAGKYNSHIVLAAVSSVVLSNLFCFLQAHLLWRLKSLSQALISFSVSMTIIATSILLILKFKLGVIGVFLSSLIGNGLGIVAIFMISSTNFAKVFHLSKLIEILKFSIPLIPSNIGYYGSLYLDQILIKHFLGLKEVGIYAVASRIVILTSLLINAFASALSPLIYQKHRDSETKRSIEKITRLFLFCVCMLTSTYTLVGHDIIQLFTTHDYAPAARLLPLLGLGYCFSNLCIFSPGLVIAKKSKIIAFCNLAGCFLNLLGCLFLIPRFGIIGAATATSVSSLLSFIVYFKFSQRLYQIKYAWNKILNATFLFLSLNICFYDLTPIFSSNLFLDLFWKATLLLAMGIFTVYLMFDKNERKEAFKYLQFDTFLLKTNPSVQD